MARYFDPEIGRATRWRKGQASPNPGGRPKNTALTEAYRAILAQRFPGDRQRRTFAQVIAARVASEAANGNLRAAAEIADRAEGKPQSAFEILQNEMSQVVAGEDFSNLTMEELLERLLEVDLETEKTFDIAGCRAQLEAARAARKGELVEPTPVEG